MPSAMWSLLPLIALLLALPAALADAPATQPAGSPGGNPGGKPTARLSRLAEKIRAGKPVTIVLWGDSISEVGRSPRWHGGASKPENNYGQVLARELAARFPGVSFTTLHAGIGGQNTYEGLGRLDSLWPMKPDLVIVEFGTNDTCYHHLQPEETGRAMSEMLTRVTEAADAVCVGTAGNHPADAKFLHTQETIDATRRAALEAGVPFVDMRPVMLDVTDQARRWGEFHLNAMNCHPNDKGHEVWAKTIADAVSRALKGE